MSDDASRKIAALNDAFLSSFAGGKVFMTHGVSALPGPVLSQLVVAVREFSTFTADNDPHGEHDFGSIELAGSRYFWKIDYYDLSLQNGSEYPEDPARTTRVLTIMSADEY